MGDIFPTNSSRSCSSFTLLRTDASAATSTGGEAAFFGGWKFSLGRDGRGETVATGSAGDSPGRGGRGELSATGGCTGSPGKGGRGKSPENEGSGEDMPTSSSSTGVRARPSCGSRKRWDLGYMRMSSLAWRAPSSSQEGSSGSATLSSPAQDNGSLRQCYTVSQYAVQCLLNYIQ